MFRVTALLAAATLASPAVAALDDVPRIQVSGTASVQTPPDRATIAYTVHGEGASSDEAVAAMVGKRERIAGGLASLKVAMEAGASRVAVSEVRGADCRQYGAARLSSGVCAIQGYAADLTVTLRTAAVEQVGTMVGLLGRLGASDPRLESFSLSAPDDAQRRAIGAALADARAKAEALAQGTGVRLGTLISASNGAAGYQEFGVREVSRAASPPPPPPVLSVPMAPPIGVALTPQPITTQVQVLVVYAVAP